MDVGGRFYLFYHYNVRLLGFWKTYRWAARRHYYRNQRKYGSKELPLPSRHSFFPDFNRFVQINVRSKNL